MKTEEELFKSLDLRLKDFKPDDEANKHWSDPNAGTVVKVKEKPRPYIVFIIFIHLKNMTLAEDGRKLHGKYQ